eukprot:jgi/Ulvmu1/2580/UM014_0031.1
MTAIRALSMMPAQLQACAWVKTSALAAARHATSLATCPLAELCVPTTEFEMVHAACCVCLAPRPCSFSPSLPTFGQNFVLRRCSRLLLVYICLCIYAQFCSCTVLLSFPSCASV